MAKYTTIPNRGGNVPTRQAVALLTEAQRAQLRGMRKHMSERALATHVGVGIHTLQSLLDDGSATEKTIARVVARLDELARGRGAA